MQIMSPEAYQQVWFLFPFGFFIYLIFLSIVQRIFGKKVASALWLVITLSIFIFLWNIVGLNIGTYFITSLYLLFGFFGALGRMRGMRSSGRSRGNSGGGSSDGGFGGGGSGGGGSSGSW